MRIFRRRLVSQALSASTRLFLAFICSISDCRSERVGMGSKRHRLYFLYLKEIFRNLNCFLLVKTLASVKDGRKEFLVTPNVHGNAGINQRNEGVITLVFFFADSARRKDYRFAIHPKSKFRGDLFEIIFNNRFVHMDCKETFD